MENEEGHTERPEKYWLDSWEEKMGGDQVTEVCVWCPQEGVVTKMRGCRQARKGDTGTGLWGLVTWRSLGTSARALSVDDGTDTGLQAGGFL